jgi:pimeloyl-ACP methyl ester carboxylesterase
VRAPRRRSSRTPRQPGRVARAVDLTARALLLVLAVVAIVGSASLHRSVTQPSAFYDPPASVPGEPGRLIRSEPYTQAVPDGARGWLILYTTTDLNDEPTVGSAFVMAPEEAGDEPRDVVLWTHGTQGADRTCAPTVLPEPLPLADPIAAQQQQIAHGRVLFGPDYPGMGTAGPQGYLVGENEGRSALDAVRAAHELADLTLSWRTVVWGHSQGGQAALWTGGLAPDYAPEVELLGVSAAAPAADVKGLIASLGESWIGQLLGPYAVRSYAETYAEVDAADYIDPRMQPIYEAASRRCLPNADTTVSLLSVLTMHGTMYRVDPATGPLGDRLDENVPTLPIDVPLFIAQGTADPLILPKVQEAYVAARCAAGQSMIFREYEGRDHLSVVADDSPYSADLLAWTDDRFAGRPQTEDTCP